MYMYRYTFIFADTEPLFVLVLVSRPYAARPAQGVLASFANTWTVRSHTLEIFDSKVFPGFGFMTENTRVRI